TGLLWIETPLGPLKSLKVGMHANLAGNLTTHPVLETRPDGEFSSKLFVAVPLLRSSLTLWHVKWLATNPAFATLAAELNQAQAEKTSTNRVAFMEASFCGGPTSPYTVRVFCVNKKIAVRGGFPQAPGPRRSAIHSRMRGLCAMKDTRVSYESTASRYGV